MAENEKKEKKLLAGLKKKKKGSEEQSKHTNKYSIKQNKPDKKAVKKADIRKKAVEKGGEPAKPNKTAIQKAAERKKVKQMQKAQHAAKKKVPFKERVKSIIGGIRRQFIHFDHFVFITIQIVSKSSGNREVI